VSESSKSLSQRRAGRLIPQIDVDGSHLANSPSFGSADAPFVNYNTTIDISNNLTKVYR